MYGAERWILALAKHLPENEVRSVIGIINDDKNCPNPALGRFAADLGISTEVFLAPGKVSWPAVDMLRRYIRENSIQILHTHGYKTDILGLFATMRTSCKNVTTPHGWSTNAGIKLRVYEALDRIAFALFDAVVPLSPDLYAGLERLPFVNRRLSLINNGLDLDEIDTELRREACAKEHANPAMCIGYVGQLIERKRVDTLIRAFAALSNNEVKLMIVGDGPERVSLEQLAAELGQSERVAFMGFRDDRIALMQKMDIFVLPSTLEGIPRCLMEAMALGIPVVASDIPGCKELVSDGKTGLLFSAGNQEELCGRLESMLSDSGLRDALAERARALIRAKYSAERMARQYADLYRSLCPG